MYPGPRVRGPRTDETNARPRKLSSSRSPSSENRGFLSRKLSKKGPPSGRAELLQSAGEDTKPLSRSQSHLEDESQAKGKGKERVQSEEPEHQSRPVFPSRSVIPDQLAELPAWYAKDAEWTSTSAAQFRIKYPIHNTLGPRFYRNHHLAPPSRDKRPPSVFSPSFPPMSTSTERLPDPTKMPGPSRTPSGSPLPTPDSSQTRIHDVRVRTRKLSQTHDGVDLLDASDPWGTNWHHQSPYDLGVNPDRSSQEAPEPSPTAPRPRRMSMTSTPRHKTAMPSPLSQSTSAVHLASEPLRTSIPRRLSKTRKSFRGLFGSDHSKSPYVSRAGSAPVTPIEFGQSLGRKISKTSSFMPASISSNSNSLAPMDKKAKRGSVLGRLAKRFSVLKRSDSIQLSQDSVRGVRNSFQAASVDVENVQGGDRRSISPQKPPTRRVRAAEPLRRRAPLPAPEVDEPPSDPGDGTPLPRELDSQSVMSVKEPFTTGRLTVANPDEPASGAETPSQIEQSSSGSTMEQSSQNDAQRILDEELRSSPTPLDTPPFMHRAPLSVISEGETYLSSPKAPPALTPQIAPMSPPTIPSVLSLPLRPALATAAISIPPFSPPLPDVPPATPVVKTESPLPPTPESTRPPTPAESVRSEPPAPAASDRQAPPYLRSPSLASIHGSSLGYVDSSPLSRVSMIVNPPTPQALPLSSLPSTSSQSAHSPLVATVPAALPEEEPKPQQRRQDQPKYEQPTYESSKQVQSKQEAVADRGPSPTKREGTHRVRSRRTETFKLVRSLSGDGEATNGGFVADGSHWAVIESPTEDSPTKSRKERERASESEIPRSNSRKVEKESNSEESDPSKRHDGHRKSSSRRQPSERETSPPADPPPSRTLVPQPESPPGRSAAPPERRRSARDSQIDAARSTRTPLIYGPPVSATTNGTSGARVERRPSNSTRPSSELHSVADLNTLKAKDAWEIERLWKGRSMIYGPEGGAPLPGTRHNINSDSRPTTIMSADLHRASTIPSVGDQTSTVTSVHGSSHTYFVVQTPYDTPMNAVSSPEIAQTQPLYPSVMQQSMQQSPTRQERRNAVRSLDRVPFPSGHTELPSPRTNPLPEPPRFSSYRPSPLPPSLAGGGDVTTNAEYWTKIAGVAVTH